jgi:hypothetical protein
MSAKGGRETTGESYKQDERTKMGSAQDEIRE